MFLAIAPCDFERLRCADKDAVFVKIDIPIASLLLMDRRQAALFSAMRWFAQAQFLLRALSVFFAIFSIVKLTRKKKRPR
tara:strand:+ start:108538 stop:108777 length:240 start_codon:yes stop_codon:yes gene_type:complete